MKTICMLLALLCGCCGTVLGKKRTEIVNMLCENQDEPTGIQSVHPVFSWNLCGSERGIYQTAYRILVADNLPSLAREEGNVWDSGKCLSDESLNIAYQGEALASATRYYWKVKVWDTTGSKASWSEVKSFQTGLLRQEDWGAARWIAMDTVAAKDVIVPGFQLAGNRVEPLERECRMPQFRRAFHLDAEKLVSATAFVSGLGHFELSVNGERVGDHFLDPGWSKYDKRALYVTFDITRHLTGGENVIGVRLGNGFLHIPRDSTRYRKLITTFAFPKLICKIRLLYKDGTTEDIDSNRDWRVTESPITFSSMYGGEDYDARLEQAGWDRPGFDDSAWRTVVELPSSVRLSAQSLPLKVRQTFPAVRVEETRPGTFVYDFGQNASAIVRLKVKGRAGAKVVMKPGEYLTADGLSNQANSGTPYWFAYTLAGRGTESWSPSFSYYGFRYVQVEGAVPAGAPNPQGLPVIEELQLLHVSNASKEVGSFHCSDSLFNAIHSLIKWSIKSNLSHVLTDCPHREKLGWLEVTHLMSRSIACCYDIRLMYRQIIEAMKDSQLENGLIPNTAPEYASFPHDFRDSPEWGSAGVILPWFLYQWYGDRSVLESSYDLMTSYVDYLSSRTREGILYHGLGDWYDLGPAHPGYSQLTSRGLTPTALYYYDLKIMAEVSGMLGREPERGKYAALAQRVKTAFNEKFFNREKGYYDQGSQTANAVPYCLGLVEEENKNSCLEQIVRDIRERGNSISSGDIGFSYLLKALTAGGYSEVIYDMNHQCEKPGYGYQLKQGATSLTESWSALQTASHNHCMLGHLMEWFYDGLGGICLREGSTAFKEFVIRPAAVVGDLDAASVSFDSPYGLIRSEWKSEEGRFVQRVRVPGNTTAWICLPVGPHSVVKEGGKSVEGRSDIRFVRTEGKYNVYRVGSGEYEFTIDN